MKRVLNLDPPRGKNDYAQRFEGTEGPSGGFRVRNYNGDCIDLLAEMADGVTDLLLTSPPYFMGKNYDRSYKVDEFYADTASSLRISIGLFVRKATFAGKWGITFNQILYCHWTSRCSKYFENTLTSF